MLLFITQISKEEIKVINYLHNFLFLILFFLILFANSSAYALTYTIEIKSIDPVGTLQYASCESIQNFCSVQMALPLPYGDKKLNVDVMALFSYEDVKLQFKAGQEILSLSGQGKETFDEKLPAKELKKTISLFLLNPAARHDPEDPYSLVLRPGNRKVAELEISILSTP